MDRTVAELIDLGASLYVENARMAQAAELVLQALAEDGARPDDLAYQLIQSIRETADHCCRVIEGPR